MTPCEAFIGALMLLTSPIFGGERFIHWSNSIANTTLYPPPASVKEIYITTITKPIPNTVVPIVSTSYSADCNPPANKYKVERIDTVDVDIPPPPQLSYIIFHGTKPSAAASDALPSSQSTSHSHSVPESIHANTGRPERLSWLLLYDAAVLVIAYIVLDFFNAPQLPGCCIGIIDLSLEYLAELLRRLQLPSVVKIDDDHGAYMDRKISEHDKEASEEDRWHAERMNRKEEDHESQYKLRDFYHEILLRRLDSEHANNVEAVQEDHEQDCVDRIKRYHGPVYRSIQEKDATIEEQKKTIELATETARTHYEASKICHKEIRALKSKLADSIKQKIKLPEIWNGNSHAEARQLDLEDKPSSGKVAGLEQAFSEQSKAHVTELAVKQNELDDSSAQLKEQRNLHTAQLTENHRLRSRIRQLGLNNSMLSRKLSEVERASIEKSGSHNKILDDKQKKIDELSTRVDDETKKLQSAKANEAKFRTLSRARQTRITQLENSLTGTSTELELVKCDVEDKKSEIKQLKDKREELKDERTELRNDIEELRDDVDGLNGEVEDKKAEIMELEDELRAMDAKYEKLGEELAGAKEDIDDLQCQVKGLEQCIEMSGDETAKLWKEKEELQRQLDNTLPTTATTSNAGTTNSVNKLETGQAATGTKSSTTATTPPPIKDVEQAAEANKSTAATPSNKSSSGAVNGTENSQTSSSSTTATTTSGEAPAPIGQTAPKAAAPAAAPPSNHGSTNALNEVGNGQSGNSIKPATATPGNQPPQTGPPAPKPVKSSSTTPPHANSSSAANKDENSQKGNGAAPSTTRSATKPTMTSQPTLTPIISGKGTVFGQNSTGFNFGLGADEKKISFDLTDWNIDQASRSVNAFNISGIQHPPANSQDAPTGEKTEDGSTVSQSSSETNNASANEQTPATVPPAIQGSSTTVTSAGQHSLMASEHAPTPVYNGSGTTTSQSSGVSNNTSANAQAPATAPPVSQNTAALPGPPSRNAGRRRRTTRGAGKRVK